MKKLSDYVVKTAYLIGVLGLLIGVSEYRAIRFNVIDQYSNVLIGIPLYILISVICFFFPLGTAHRVMEEARDTLLKSIANQFRNDYDTISRQLAEDGEALKASIGKIQHLQTLYDMTIKFPVWPFDVQTLRQFLLSTTTPIIPPIVGLIVAYVKLQWLP